MEIKRFHLHKDDLSKVFGRYGTMEWGTHEESVEL